jgi:hypothetical protein
MSLPLLGPAPAGWRSRSMHFSSPHLTKTEEVMAMFVPIAGSGAERTCPLVIDDGPPHGKAWDRGLGLGPHCAIEGFGKASAAGG